MDNNEKASAYSQAARQVAALIDGVENTTGALANVSALLKETFDSYFWVGFYLVHEGRLELGPFQGPVACYTIGKGRGVCGTAWEQAQTVIVPDVELFPGHIACSSKSRSEIVVPVFKAGTVVAVIDVDSTRPGAFDNDDGAGLEEIARLVSSLF